MKTSVSLLLMAIFSVTVHMATGQDISAKYSVTQQINVAQGSSGSYYVTLDFEGFLYKSGGQNIYYQKPLYLKKYPQGSVTYTPKSGEYYIYPLVMDTLQRICYNNADSFIFRMSSESASIRAKRDFIVRSFQPGLHEWEILQETKNIDGLYCQRAKFYSSVEQKELVWDVWFCPEIPVNFGPSYIRDIPGLVVEADCVPGNEKYKLLSYEITKGLNASLFWPDEFAGVSFKSLAPFQRMNIKPAALKTKDQKRAEVITNNQ